MKPKIKPLSIEECSSIEISIQTFALFEYFYQKLYKGTSFTPTSKAIVAHQKFLSTINHQNQNLLQDNKFWWKYFLFQFIYWSKLQLLDEKEVSYVYIIGPKAWERWINRNETYDFTILSNSIKNKYLISYIDYSNHLLIKKKSKNHSTSKSTKISLSESLLRNKFHNTERGLNLCLTSTSLYDPADKSCTLCNQKNICKIILKNSNRRLFDIRVLTK